MISIDAPFRVSEEFRAFGVCLLMYTSRAPCTSTGTSLILPSSRLSLQRGHRAPADLLQAMSHAHRKGLLRPDHWMILIVRLDRALIAMPRRDARQVQQTVQQTGKSSHVESIYFNALRGYRGRASPPCGAPRCNKLGH